MPLQNNNNHSSTDLNIEEGNRHNLSATRIDQPSSTTNIEQPNNNTNVSIPSGLQLSEDNNADAGIDISIEDNNMSNTAKPPEQIDEQADDDVNNNIDHEPSVATSSSGGIVGLEQVDDDDNSDMPLPTDMAEMISNTVEPPKQQISKVEQLEDDGDLGPEPPAAVIEASLNDAEKSNKTIRSSLESIDDEHIPPTPFDSTNFEQDDTIAKKKAKDEMNNQTTAAVSNDKEKVVLSPPDRDSIYEPSRGDIEIGEELRSPTNRRGREVESRAAHRDIESQTRTDNNDDTVRGINNDSMVDMEANVVPTLINQEGLPEIEAYLVEEEEEVEV